MLPSPLPVHNYAEPLVVVGEPYDYGTDYAFVNIDPDRKIAAAEGQPAPEEQAPAAPASSAAAD